MGSLVQTSFSEVMATLEVLQKCGVTSAHLKKIRSNNQLAIKVADLISSFNFSPKHKDVVEVKIEAHATYPSLISRCKLDEVSDDISQKNFPVQNFSSYVEPLVWFAPDNSFDNQRILNLLNNNNLVPASIKYLLAMVIQYPDYVEGKTIAALGSIKEFATGLYMVPYFACTGSKKVLTVFLSADLQSWPRGTVFLALKKDD